MTQSPNLDVVRSLAVISVVVEHFLLVRGVQQVGPFPTAWIGVLGVMVFFVLTSLVLMWSLERRPHTLDFYIRRWFRIYPLVIVVLLVVTVLHVPTGGGPEAMFAFHRPSLGVLLGNMSLMPGSTQTLLTVTWTLPYEVGMYLLLPMVFFFVRRNFSLWPLMVLWLLVIQTTRKMPASGHNFAVAIGYFLPGVMAWVVSARWRARLPGWLLLPWIAALWVAFLWKPDFHKCWLFCLLVGLSLPLFRAIESSWVLAPSRVIARYSYGVYLTHPVALAFGFYLLRGRSLEVQMSGFLVLLVVLPVLAYHAVELPMIRLGSRLANKAEQRWEQHERETVFPAA